MTSEVLQARMEANPERAIPCIKAIRAACGCGLREAKDTYDAIRNGDGQQVVRLTFAEFGRLSVEHMLDSGWLFYFTECEIIRPDEKQFIELGKASALAG